MGSSFWVAAPSTLAAAFLLTLPAAAEKPANPMRFFEGRTESVSTIKVLMKKAHRSRAIGNGVIKPDGSLHLVQKVEEEGKPPRERRWHIRQVGPGRFSGTMTEASGPVIVDEVGGRYRFRFKLKGGLAVEQWLTPTASGTSAESRLTVRKMGMTVARSHGVIRKLR